jgi:hypothetical protein
LVVSPRSTAEPLPARLGFSDHPGVLIVQQAAQPDGRIKDAEDKAEGDVAVAIRDSRELAAGHGSSTDAGMAFFMSTFTVAQKCKADEVTIDLRICS